MNKFHQELAQLKIKTLEMGNFSLQMLSESVQALKNQDMNLADKVYNDRKKLNDYDRILEDESLRLIALYQPMATDLRTIACVLKAITYLQRIGRYGKDISNVAKQLNGQVYFKKLISIPQMETLVIQMGKDVLLAFDKSDISYLKDISKRDDEIDELRFSIFRECITYMMEDPKTITQSTHFLMVARYLERCGDHVCKIAEKVHYMVTGERIEIK